MFNWNEADFIDEIFNTYQSNNDFEQLELNCLALRDGYRDVFLKITSEQLKNMEALEEALQEVANLETVNQSCIPQLFEMEKFNANISQEVSQLRVLKEQIESCFSDPTQVNLDMLSTLLPTVQRNQQVIDFLARYGCDLIKHISHMLSDPTIMAIVERVLS